MYLLPLACFSILAVGSVYIGNQLSKSGPVKQWSDISIVVVFYYYYYYYYYYYMKCMQIFKGLIRSENIVHFVGVYFVRSCYRITKSGSHNIPLVQVILPDGQNGGFRRLCNKKKWLQNAYLLASSCQSVCLSIRNNYKTSEPIFK